MIKHIELLNQLCDSWGLPKTVRSMTIQLDVSSMPLVIVEIIDESLAGETLTKQFSLVERPMENVDNG